MEAGTQRILIYRSWQLWTLLLVTLGLVLAGGWWLYQLGKYQGGEQLIQMEREHSALHEQIATLERERERLGERMAVLERSSQVDHQASMEVRQSLGALQEELTAAREELAFYQGIMSPGDVQPGLRVQKLQWEPGAAEGSFRYDLMLTQVKRNDRVARGVVHLSIVGDQEGKPATLELAKITQPAIEKLHFRFRYFQHFEGEIQLPASFRPRTVRIKLAPKGKYGPPGLERTFDWPA